MSIRVSQEFILTMATPKVSTVGYVKIEFVKSSKKFKMGTPITKHALLVLGLYLQIDHLYRTVKIQTKEELKNTCFSF